MVLAIITGLLCLMAAGFLIAALLLALLEVMPAPLAALSVALVLALIAGFLVLVSRSRRPRSTVADRGLAEDFLPALNLVAKQKPWAAFAAATVLGAVTEIAMKNGASRKQRD